MSFPVWFISKMHNLGYQKSHMHKDADLTIWFNFTNGSEDFNVCYVMKPIEPNLIRDLFEHNSDRPILFIVDENIIQGIDANKVPLWLKALHAIYYGRVYIWIGDGITALHFNWVANNTRYSGYLDIDGILFTDTDCKLKDFPGIFHIARFYDRAFWTESAQAKGGYARQSHNNPNYSQKKTDFPDDDVYEAFKRAYREHMHNHNAYEPPTKPRYAPKGDKWLDLFIGTGSIDAARVKYRELAKQYHPDLNPGSTEALSTMQAINIAFDKVKEYWR